MTRTIPWWKGLKCAIHRSFHRLGYDFIRWPPHHDPLALHLGQIFPQLGINCVLDAGSHHGEYGLYLRSLGYSGAIISFEPLPESFQVLRKQCDRDHSWSAFPFALGDQDGKSSFHVTQETALCSILKPNEFSRRWSGEGSRVLRIEEIEVRRIENIFEECTRGIAAPRVFLKMDTQGYDMQIVRGAGRFLRDIAGLQTEVSVMPLYDGMAGYWESLARLKEHGFEVTGLFPAAQENDLRVVEFDCVMIRPPPAAPGADASSRP